MALAFFACRFDSVHNEADGPVKCTIYAMADDGAGFSDFNGVTNVVMGGDAVPGSIVGLHGPGVGGPLLPGMQTPNFSGGICEIGVMFAIDTKKALALGYPWGSAVDLAIRATDPATGVAGNTYPYVHWTGTWGSEPIVGHSLSWAVDGVQIYSKVLAPDVPHAIVLVDNNIPLDTRILAGHRAAGT